MAADEHAAVVVVGSGFGGSVAAYRFAEAGRQVVVLERGRTYPPGSFPRTPAEMTRAVWDPSGGLHGMLDVWSFRGIDAIVASGLGGGSLIYANVLLRKDERWFVRDQPIPGGGYEDWPVTRADLDPHYDRVERTMMARPYPFAHPPYDSTPKTVAMASAAADLKLEWQLPPLAVSFAPSADELPAPGRVIREPSYGNLHGVPRVTCRLCGECNIGCNEGAKNSLDHTYLSAAQHKGADLRVRHEVRGVAPRHGGGYEVRYVIHEDPGLGEPRDTARLPERVISCDRLIMAAGTLGTTWLLLRNREQFGGLSRALGSRFSGNGDMLGFVSRARTPDGSHRPLRGSQGPVITSAIRVPDEVDAPSRRGTSGRGYYVQDAGYPAFADWLTESSQWPGYLRRAVMIAVARARARFSRTPGRTLGAELGAFLGGNELSDGSLPLLGMGRDIPDGVLRVERDRLTADWITGTSEGFFASVESTMRDVADALGGTFRPNPLRLVQELITVHPVGGAPMGRHVEEGVVDSRGEVFGFPGLYIADGAALPGAVGPNPALTIAALADRMCDFALSAAPRSRPAAPYPPKTPADEPTTSLSLSEEMPGS
ncbi:GMC oxidoreductase [Actinoplanes sp. NPDC089786]|uniref:GMC oxidoreductase n=1 Tax=Actinoplanes sp. NPDC089786 TaxID=3155185 RepID=UPI00342526AB